ncbi:MAG: SDR family oxidoreductase [Patescibacteria group bacterium]|nr:SDR family oxidoreductase [Patescibacteria group bacterium]
MKTQNKVALITGASKGMGAATAIALAKEGCSVIINYKTDKKSADKVLAKCNIYSKHNIAIKADITNEDDIKKMITQIKKNFSSLHILVNNAGIFDENDNHTNIQVFENIFRNNLLGAFMVTKYALNIMRQGKIINISSIHGRLGYGRPTAIAYAAFKAALENYTKNLAKKLAPQILVNAIAPGRVATSMWDNPTAAEQKKLGSVHLIKRMIQPEEIADAIVFLIKNDAVCAEVLTIDGGYRLANLS